MCRSSSRLGRASGVLTAHLSPRRQVAARSRALRGPFQKWCTGAGALTKFLSLGSGAIQPSPGENDKCIHLVWSQHCTPDADTRTCRMVRSYATQFYWCLLVVLRQFCLSRMVNQFIFLNLPIYYTCAEIFFPRIDSSKKSIFLKELVHHCSATED